MQDLRLTTPAMAHLGTHPATPTIPAVRQSETCPVVTKTMRFPNVQLPQAATYMPYVDGGRTTGAASPIRTSWPRA